MSKRKRLKVVLDGHPVPGVLAIEQDVSKGALVIHLFGARIAYEADGLIRITTTDPDLRRSTRASQPAPEAEAARPPQLEV